MTEITPKQLQQIHQFELEMLKMFLHICEQENLSYFLIDGSLLGAVRHQGFIPWDDDIDIAMPRTDYEKFLQRANQYLPEYYFLSTYKTEPNALFPYAKIYDTRTKYVESVNAHLPIHHNLWIDIFPFDFCTSFKKFWVQRENTLLNLRRDHWSDPKRAPLFTQFLRRISYLLYPRLEQALHRQNRLLAGEKESAPYIAYLACPQPKKIFFPSEWFAQYTYLPFEQLQVRVPAHYHEYLTYMYGNYQQLPPKEQQIPKHMPSEIYLPQINDVK